MSTTTQDLLSAAQYVLLELPDGGATFPSGLWTQAEVLAALSERQNRFLKSTLLLVGTIPITGVLPGEHRFPLPQDWLTTVVVVWMSDDGTTRALARSDTFEADHGLLNWVNQRGLPLMYMDEESPTLQVQVAPSPDVSGSLLLIYVPSAPDLTLGVDETLTLPDAYALPVLKYDLLAQLFGKDGRGKNPEKAAYCEMRRQLGVEMVEIMKAGWI